MTNKPTNINDQNKKLTQGRFLVAANAFIFNGDKILIAKRTEDRDHDAGNWECVSGRFDQHFETVEDEIVQEVKEELGEKFEFRLIAPISFYHFYRGDRKEDELVGINFICQYLGGEITLSSEHTEWQWMEPEKVLKLNLHELLRKDINHLIKVKDFYLNKRQFFIYNSKKSN